LWHELFLGMIILRVIITIIMMGFSIYNIIKTLKGVKEMIVLIGTIVFIWLCVGFFFMSYWNKIDSCGVSFWFYVVTLLLGIFNIPIYFGERFAEHKQKQGDKI
jgi:hypothetical protein